MADVLSQNEVESLLAALDGGDATTASQAAMSADPLDGQISVYDFKRPERVSKEQMRAFQALHEGFSREFGAALSGMLRAIVEVKLISVDQLTYSEFVFSLENPTCFNLLESKGLEGNVILDINPSIIFPIVDRLLGGGKSASLSAHPQRPLTEIEIRLVSRITKLAIGGLETAWSNLCDLGLKVTQVESNPQLVQIVPPNEVIVLVSFEITMGEIRGIMNLCIPFNTIEPLAGKLSSDTWSAYTKKEADPRQKASLETGLGRAKVPVSIEMARTTLSAADVAGLSVGDIITTKTGVGEGLTVYVAGRSTHHAAPGHFKGHKAVRVTGKVRHAGDAIDEKLSGSPAAEEASAKIDP
ncbi:MAG: flagellar motor switch protein FliM [Planctomycetota bacterium]